MPLKSSAGRAPLLLAASLAVALGACGRRGPLEPPVDSPAIAAPSARAPAASAPTTRRAAPADPRLRPGAARSALSTTTPASLATDPLGRVEDSPDSDDNDDEVTESVAPIPTARKRNRAYVVPTEPFVLDPLL